MEQSTGSEYPGVVVSATANPVPPFLKQTKRVTTVMIKGCEEERGKDSDQVITRSSMKELCSKRKSNEKQDFWYKK